MLRLASVLAQCRLPPPQLEYLFQLVLNYDELPPEDTLLGCGEALMLWAVDLLATVNLVQPPDQPFVASKLQRALLPYSAACVAAVTANDCSKLPDFPIGFADRRYLSISGSPKLYDLRTCRTVEGADRPLETLVYNLGELFTRNYATYRKLEREHARDPSAALSTPEGSPSRP